jgi:hypothetical protein
MLRLSNGWREGGNPEEKFIMPRTNVHVIGRGRPRIVGMGERYAQEPLVTRDSVWGPLFLCQQTPASKQPKPSKSNPQKPASEPRVMMAVHPTSSQPATSSIPASAVLPLTASPPSNFNTDAAYYLLRRTGKHYHFSISCLRSMPDSTTTSAGDS